MSRLASSAVERYRRDGFYFPVPVLTPGEAAGLRRRLEALAGVSPSMFPERIVATTTGVSLGEASRQFERAKTVTAVPELGAVLAAGEIGGGHVDVVTRALRELNPEQRQQLAAEGPALAQAAAVLGRDEFAKHLRRELRAR